MMKGHPCEVPNDTVLAVAVVSNSMRRLQDRALVVRSQNVRRAALAPAYFLVAGLETAWPFVIGTIPIRSATSF